MSTNEETHEDIGFDETEDLTADDVVTLEAEDGSRVECVVLAILDLEGASYAILTETGDDEGELLVTAYAEDEDGTAHFSPVSDDTVLAGLQGALADLVPMADPAMALTGTVAEA